MGSTGEPEAYEIIRSLQRRLTCVGLFVAFLLFSLTYLFYSNSEALLQNDSFFESSLTFEDWNNSLGKNNSLGNSSSTTGDDVPFNISANASGSYLEPEAPSPAAENSTLLKEILEKNSTSEAFAPSGSLEQTTSTKNSSSDLQTSNLEECDLKQGKWIPDKRLPLYNSSNCKYIQEFQNCEKNGRPDVGYLFWKWKPEHCEVPRVDASAFLSAMRNRVLVFAGDSIARNQFQSLLCILSQVEEPKDVYHSEDGRNYIYLFQGFNATIRIHWAPYLVRFEESSITWNDNTTDLVTRIYLDELDQVWVKAVVGADILQISTGQWWYKRAMYVQKGKPIGCHGWPSCFKEIGFAEPYSMAMAHILKGSLQIPGFNGTTVYRSFAPDHFEGGEWDTGGACPRTSPGGVPISYLAQWMYNIQLQQFQNVTEELGVVAEHRLKMLDITNIAQIRGDGHPNGFRVSLDKQENSSQKDCLHWCLPGPIDTWNDLLVESLRDVIFERGTTIKD